MIMNKWLANIIITAVLVSLPAGMWAQEPISKEVKVVKPYVPTLSSASKINLLPKMEDTLRLSTDFKYIITPKNFQPVYKFSPLKPARMESESISKLYHSYLKLGFGNYLTPQGELHINTLRKKKSSAGVYLKHISSYGKVKLDNSEKVFAGYGDTDFLTYGKKIMKKAVLNGELGVNHNWNHYYGYDTSIDTSLANEDIRLNFLDIYSGLKLHSINIDSDKINYELGGTYHYFTDKFNNPEHEIEFEAGLDKALGEGQSAGGRLTATVLASELYGGSGHNSFIGIEPWYSQAKDEWKLDLALNISIEMRNGNSRAFFYPKARFEFNVIPRYLTSYVGVEGGLDIYSYKNMLNINPYMVPGQVPEATTNRKLFFSGGFQGSFSRKSAWHLRGSYGLIDDMYFFVNDTLSELKNQFRLEYDDVELGQVQAELSTAIGGSAIVYVKENYYFYNPATETRAWHKANVDAVAGLRYDLKNKILIDLDVYYTGKRYAKSYVFGVPETELKGFADMNLKIEYRYTRILSAYLCINNMFGSYQRWNQYNVQGFLLRAGFTYSL